MFTEGMKKGRFVDPVKHRGFVTLLHYSAVRVTEALNTLAGQGRTTPTVFYYDVGSRLKHSLKTPPLPLPLEAPYMNYVVDSFRDTPKDKKVFPYCRKTGYNIVNRVFKYPHYHRLSRITQFFLDGFSIAEVRSWTGLSLNALNYYVGLVGIDEMGRALKTKQKRRR
jgi:hypothetical protein